MIGESILELHETNATDESIKFYEYDEYKPITGTHINSAGHITITIENQDQFLHNVQKADDTKYADDDLVALTNNGLLYPYIGWTDGGTCYLSWPGYITSWFDKLFINIS